MGTMAFQLPKSISAEAETELECACLGGGQDGMPFPTHVGLEPGLLFVERNVNESGFLMTPWDVEGFGRLMLSSATLMERRSPYDFLLELARGKTHLLRNQVAEWVGGGLILSPDAQSLVRDATHAFGRCASASGKDDGDLARKTLDLGHRAAHRLVQTYIEQVFQVRHLRQARLETLFGCQIDAIPEDGVLSGKLREGFNTVAVPFAWKDVEPSRGNWNWSELDQRTAWALEWAGKTGTVIGGPLVDFSGRGMPDWLWSTEPGLPEISERINAFIDAVIRRYGSKIRHWRLTSASNLSGVLATNDEELIWLTVRTIEVVRKIDPQLHVSIGLCQPWGDYLATQEHNVTPFGFADTLLRTGVRLDVLELELLMGFTPRGSYCRDTLDVSRMLDLYVLLGVPIAVTLGYPSASTPDGLSDGDVKVGGGHWGAGYTAEDQAAWVDAFAKVVLCKPYVQTMLWSHWDDRKPHQFPHCGLVDPQGAIKPAFDSLRRLRTEHLK